MSAKMPWKTNGAAGSPCCCAPGCNAIPMSLCSDEAVAVCGFPEFTAPASGEDPEAEGYVPAVEASCPPKFYKTRTVVYHHAKTKTQSVICGGSYVSGPPEEYTQGAAVDITYVYETLDYKEKKTLAIDGDLECSPTITGEGTGLTAGWDNEMIATTECGPNAFENWLEPCKYGSITWTYNAETGDFEWQTTIPDPTWEGDICACPEIPYTATHGYSFEYDWELETSSWSPLVITITTDSEGNPQKTITYTDAEFTMTVTITLSDEVTLSDTLKSKTCDEDFTCDPAEDEGCEACCTCDEVAYPECMHSVSGRKWRDTPEGCITPGSSYMAYDSSPCDESGDRSGQGVELSLWFAGLTPGRYRATISFKRCEFAKVDGEYQIPYCGVAAPCTDAPPSELTLLGPDFTVETGEWAVIFSDNCGRCDIQRLACQLNDEADLLDISDPLEVARTVVCTSGGMSTPSIPNHYTWFDHCTLEVVET